MNWEKLQLTIINEMKMSKMSFKDCLGVIHTWLLSVEKLFQDELFYPGVVTVKYEENPKVYFAQLMALIRIFELESKGMEITEEEVGRGEEVFLQNPLVSFLHRYYIKEIEQLSSVIYC